MIAIKINYEKLPYQEEFHDAEEFYDILSAGMGAGKTHALCMKMFKLMKINRGIPGGLLCPDLKMFRRDVLSSIDQICFENGIKYKFSRMDSELFFPTTQSKIMVFHSEDDGRSIRGPNLGFGLVNEVTLCSREAFDAFVSRIRLKEAKLRQIAMSGTPEGFNWFYREFIEKPRDDVRVIYGDMRQNKHVAAEYYRNLNDRFDEASRQSYIEGKFVNMAGKAAAYAFNRRKHGTRGATHDPQYPTWFAVDFNVDPMAASIWQPIPIGNDRIKLKGIGEIKLRDASTDALGKFMKQWCEEKKIPLNHVTVYPDPAGKARSTKSLQSDHLILRQWGFVDLRFKNAIGSVRDCINALNLKLEKSEIEVDLDLMPETIADLEQCTWRDGTFEIDKRDQTRTHWIDGLKNMVDFEFPVGKGRGGWREVKIR